jgi:hypothetical protein
MNGHANAVNLLAELRSVLRMRMGRRGRAAVLAWASPMVDAYVSGLASGDYPAAAANFSSELRATFGEAAFLSQRRQVLDAVGLYDSHAVQAVQRQGSYVLVVSLVFFERERKGVLRALFDPSSQELVGVWLASPKLRPLAS